MRKLLLVAMALSLTIALHPATSAAAASCDTPWGSTRERSDRHPDAVMTTARAGQHACFDRFVVEVDGRRPGYVVRYVDRFVADASGRVVNLDGAATLSITLLGVRAHDNVGNPTYRPAKRSEMVNVDGFRTFRQAFWGGTFEGTTTVGLGVRARLPFRVFTLDGPGSHKRLVIDVAHRW